MSATASGSAPTWWSPTDRRLAAMRSSAPARSWSARFPEFAIATGIPAKVLVTAEPGKAGD